MKPLKPETIARNIGGLSASELAASYWLEELTRVQMPAWPLTGWEKRAREIREGKG